MAYTQADLDRIEAEIAAVERSVSFGDRSVTSKSIDELMKARDIIRAALAQTSSSTRCTYTSFTKD